METQDIKNMGLAYLQVLEAMKKKKMDPVGQADADIDNDGDVDKSDEYLHNRRKAISKAVKEDAAITNEEAEFDEAQIMLEGAIDLAKRIIKRGVGTVTGSLTKKPGEVTARLESVDGANKSVKEQLDHSHAKQVANSIAKSNKNLKVTSSGNRHFVHHKEDPEGESGYVSVHSSNGQLHVSHEMGQAHGNKKFNDARSATAHGVRVSSGGVSEAWSVSEAKKMSISAKQIKAALASAKAQAKPKDQVSLKKAPFDIPKESVEVERSWTILNRIQEKAIAPRDMNHVKGATPPEAMDSKESPKAKEFAATSGVPASVTLDANVVAQQTADAIRASAAKISGNSNRPNDQKTGDKNIIKSTVAESKGLTKLKAFLKLNK